ncbi:MAG: pyridoxamine 5'-phosphate oxidase family protein, partial [Ketobacteraceae bacterium]|nr:pyridoxamine 5'-phosphate oxidase family protein [Ketobacteraceae bacterium]
MNSNNVEESNTDQARLVLSQHFYGVLSTLSVKFSGHPFGSVVPYCLDYQGRPLILISRLAQHTRNLQQDPRLSLLVLDRAPPGTRGGNGGNVQTDARLTLVGKAIRVTDPAQIEACAQRYYRHFPDTAGYHSELDFEFYSLVTDTLRFIPGFGQACWLSAERVLKANPFSPEEEHRIVDHMNDDHQDALLHYHQS